MSNAIKRPEAKTAPTQARALARLNAILAAANSFILSGNIDMVTTTAVAKRAGIPVGSVYRYFEDRTHILDQLYRTAYAEVESRLMATQASIPPDQPLADTVRVLLQTFWREAREHPSFRTLTRWANQHYSMWAVMPAQGSSLAALIEKTLSDAGVRLPETRREAATKTMVSVISILADQSLEEGDEDKAQALIDELCLLLTRYLA